MGWCRYRCCGWSGAWRTVNSSLIMSNSTSAQGPGKGALATIQRIFTLLHRMVQTRLELIAVELEEEKANLFQLLMLVGLTLVFTGFCLMGLFILVCLAIDPVNRVLALSLITGILFLLAVITGIWAMVRVKRSTFLKETRHQLKLDRILLEDEK
ncbi:phage holin family protein [Budviciaceae bacterium BWR-B9]|uniref:Phage holin family protein n=2 Tax=Budviciaceae TaxID=1903416 RepID=A0ABS1IU25_9GAMM|nr:phage holin family protein [Limnobaculum allomyrinae]MBV7693110.1 phage holin family protein [Limnobaculum sp. M2-1]